jgi:hypothetical protein
MARRKNELISGTVENVRPYVERALTDEDFRADLRDALVTARSIYGDLQKRNGGIKSATRFATDKDIQEQLRGALENLSNAGERLQGKKKSHKGRNTVLLAGVIAGALYNPWTGPQTRAWLLERIAGSDELEPLDDWETMSEKVDSAVAKATESEPESVTATE